jgi:hypothetical protein
MIFNFLKGTPNTSGREDTTTSGSGDSMAQKIINRTGQALSNIGGTLNASSLSASNNNME